MSRPQENGMFNYVYNFIPKLFSEFFFSLNVGIKPAKHLEENKSWYLISPKAYELDLHKAVLAESWKSVNMRCLWHPIFLSFSSAEGPDPCELAQNPRYRKGPDVCFDNNENVRHKHSHAFVERISRETA